MLKFQINLNVHEKNEESCAPTILVTDDVSENSCPIIFPEGMETKGMQEALEKLVNDLQGEYSTAEEVRLSIYGDDRSE